jgi:UNC-6/NTR/C345C module
VTFFAFVAVLHGVVMSRKTVGSDWVKFTVHAVNRYKHTGTLDFDTPKSSKTRLRPPADLRRHRSSSNAVFQTETVWVQTRDLACGCPRFSVRQAYLLAVGDGGMTEEGDWVEPSTGNTHRRRSIVLGRDALVMPWRDEWATRLKQFARDEQRGKC